MSITDELRGYADHEAPHYELSKLHAIADRIDAEHGASIIRMNETIRRIVAQGETIRAEVERLKAENARLRKLVQDMLDYGEGAGTGMFEWFFDHVRGLWRDKEEDDG